MDWQLAVTILGVLTGALGFALYIRSILSGETKPHRVTWGGWTFVGILGVLSSHEAGAGVGLLVSAAFAVGVAIVFCLSLIPKYGKPGGTRAELIAGIIAALALVTQLFIDYPPSLGATIAIAADIVFLWPTLKAAWNQPETEALFPWGINLLSVMLGILALGNYSYPAAGYSIYLLLGDAAVFSALLIQKPKLATKKKSRKPDIS